MNDDYLFGTLPDKNPTVLRMYCGCKDRGEMVCTGIVFPINPEDPIGFLHECTICGCQEIYPMPFPMFIYDDDEESDDDY